MLNKRELEEKKKYILERLKGNNFETEEINLKSTLASIIVLEQENEKLSHVRLYNFLNTVSKGKLVLKRNNDLKDKYIDIVSKLQSPIDNDYLSFLLKLAENVSKMEIEYDEDQVELNSLKLNDEKKIELSKIFFNELKNETIKNTAHKVLSDSSHYGFTNHFSKESESIYGITVYDTVFNKPYITTQRLGNIMGLQAFNHEIMHGIDFYIGKRRFGEGYYGFHETPTYTIDYLYLDFLEKMRFDKNQVDALRRKKLQYASSLAKYEILGKIRTKLIHTVGIKDYKNASIEDIRNIIDDDLLKNLLELESCVIAHGLYQEIRNNERNGLSNLETVMSTLLPRNKIPDFSFIGFKQEKILEISKNMGMIHLEKKKEVEEESKEKGEEKEDGRRI